MLIKCPWCGERDAGEFSYGGDASRPRPAEDAAEADWLAYVYDRDNPRGPHQEFWQHSHGCRQWLRLRRDTLSHEVLASGPAGEPLGDGE
ncbi:MAG: sarcosine oxidase subunit delta [Alphaproteobacteria bacterium]|jgi:heterotetrameric sarcosine oxidase delta subunit|nr:sarcosine oxidase subunit delta [Alphaproteobacteria bacterium]MDP6566649.1 sarcosine oxidase subunit delta [Alphaproteobacteria bacterium]MDP6812013.1 sarcosine oxidase subunit delta [Alphaproteobacteria bacterium]